MDWYCSGETATCLYNFPHENQLLPRVLPGTMLSLDEQCKRDRGTNACFVSLTSTLVQSWIWSRIVVNRKTLAFALSSSASTVPPVIVCHTDRQPKGPNVVTDRYEHWSNEAYKLSHRCWFGGQVCRNGKCLAEIENIIPDYTHVSQTISRVPPPPNPDRILSRSDSASGRRHTRFRNRMGLARNYLRVAAPTVESPQVSLPENGTDSKIDSVQCRNNVERMAGSLSCGEFLERFGDKYCKHDYIKRNCCASHALLCTKREH